MNVATVLRRNRARAVALAVLLTHGQAALAQTPFWEQPQQSQPPAPATPPPTRAPATTPPARPAPPPGAATVIARIDGKPITQADFDRVATPYFARMRQQFGAGFDGDIVKIANHNVLDELLRRELLRIESRRQKVEPTQADIDSVLSRDPYFWTNGSFDAAKYNLYKSSPSSNYAQMLPELRELAAMDLLDRRLRERMAPTPVALREEWAKRNDQVKFHSFAVLQRDISLDPESTEKDWEAYYRAHPDAFVRRTRVRLRYVRLPLPAAGDSTRAAEERRATEQARAVLDSLRNKTLPDTSARLQDSGLFEALSANLPVLGFVPELQAELGRADSVASVHAVGPVITRDAVIAGVITEREPKHLPPLREVLGDVRRQADLEKRRTAAEEDRRGFYAAHPDRFRTRRMTITRLTLADAAIMTKPPTAAEIERWYTDNWRRFLSLTDTTRKSPPALTDSLRAQVRPRVMHDLRPKQVEELTTRLLSTLKSSKDPRGAARALGAAAETLTLVQGVTNDTLFVNPLVEDQYRQAASRIGVVQGPQSFNGRYVVWRVDAADTAFVPPFDTARNKVDAAFRETQRLQDETDARAYFEPRQTSYKSPVQYAIDCVRVRMTPADSVKIGDSELRAYYAAHKDRFRQEEQIHARHLLIMARNASDAVEAKARARADSLLKAVKAGADFVDLCRRFSQEPGAPTSAGDLGWFGRGRMVREFEQAAFALKPGEISDVVQTQFGFHIIRLEERKPAGIRSYEEARNEIHTELAQSRSDSTARRAALTLRRKLALGSNAATLAKPHGGVVSPAPFAATESVPGVGFLQGLAADLPKLVPGRWAPSAYRSVDQFVLVRLRQKIPQHPATFDEVKTQVIDDMKAAKKRDLLAQKVTAIRAALANGAAADSVAAPWGGLRENSPVTANAAFVPTLGFGPHVMPKILKLKPGELSDTLSTPLGVMWVRFDQRVSADPGTFKTQKEQIRQELLIDRMNEWLEKTKKSVRIEVLRADLREPKPGPYKTVTFGGGG